MKKIVIAFMLLLSHKFLFTQNSDTVNYQINGKQFYKIIFYSKNNSILETISYKNGKKEGVNIKYYPDGNIKYYMNYKDDVLDGWYYRFLVGGTLEMKAHYKQGKLDGVQTAFYTDTGKTEFERNYKEGEISKYIRGFTETGRLINETRINNDGSKVTTIYYLSGRKQVIAVDKKGNIISKIWYDEKGNIVDEK